MKVARNLGYERRDLVLVAGIQMPGEVRDREVLTAVWPLLERGSPRTMLLGKLIVGLGLDSATANRRLKRVLAELAEQGLIADHVLASGSQFQPHPPGL
jgi:hypothetical protein